MRGSIIVQNRGTKYNIFAIQARIFVSKHGSSHDGWRNLTFFSGIDSKIVIFIRSASLVLDRHCRLTYI